MGGLGLFESSNLAGEEPGNKRQFSYGSMYGGLPRDIVSGQFDADISPFEDQPQRVPQPMVSDTEGPFYSSVEFTDRYGKAIPEAEKITKKTWIVYRIKEIEKKCADDDHVRIPALLLALTQVHRESVYALIDAHLPLPFDKFFVACPWIRFRMGASLWADGGPDTAETGQNYSDVVLQLNGTIKKWLLHYTDWFGTAIYDEAKIIFDHNSRFQGLLGGYDTTIYNSPDDFDPVNLDYHSSLFVFDCGGNLKRSEILEPVSLTFKLNERCFPYNFANRQELFGSDRQQLPSGIYYSTVWRFFNLNANTILNRETFAAERDSTHINEVMYSGPQRLWDCVEQKFSNVIEGQGHVGNIFPPFLNVFAGQTLMKETVIADMRG